MERIPTLCAALGSWLPWPVLPRIPSAVVIYLLCRTERLWETSEMRRANRSTKRGSTSRLWDAPSSQDPLEGTEPCPRTMSGSQSSVWSGLNSLYLWGGFGLKGWALHPSATGFTGVALGRVHGLQGSFGGKSGHTLLRGRGFWGDQEPGGRWVGVRTAPSPQSVKERDQGEGWSQE